MSSKRPVLVPADDVDDSDRAPSDGLFCIRDLLLFEDKGAIPGVPTNIIVRPSEVSLLSRIVMHHSIARKLQLEEFRVGSYSRIGAGSCEIFLADGVPNWTPHRLRLTETEPLILTVRNMTNMPLKLAGSVIVYVRDSDHPVKLVKAEEKSR